MGEINLNINYVDWDKLTKNSTVEFGFSISGDSPVALRFKIYDPFFNIQYIPGEHTIEEVSPFVNYWVLFEVDLRAAEEKPNTRFGFRLVVEDLFGNMVFEKMYLTNEIAHSLRNKSKKVAWIIGDSNAWASFGNDDFRYPEIEGYTPVRIGVTSLSLNRFIKGNQIDFIKGLPIESEDLLVFYLGEIDFRYTIHKHCLNKNLDLEKECTKLVNDYLSTLDRISKEYKNRILILSPNPPMPDGFIEDRSLIYGTKEGRKKCFNIFDFLMESQERYEYLNWTKEYTNADGFIKTEFLYEKNHHIKKHDIIYRELSKKIKWKKMETKLQTKESLDPKELVDYCLDPNLMENCIFMQVYEEFLTLAQWLSGFKPNNILEIGTMGSTFWIFSKLSTGKKVSIDIDPRQSIIHHFMYGENWRFFQGDSHTQEMLEKVKNFCPKFDFIFIDGDHSYEGVKKDFEMYKSLLSPRGVIGFHDIDPDHMFADSYAGQVYKFWQDLDEGSKTNIVCKKSSGAVKLNGIHPQGFGGIGLWRP